MTKQIPAERPLPDKQHILEQVLACTDEKPARKTWLLPVAAAASIAVVAVGALTLPSMVKSDHGSGAAGRSAGTDTALTNEPTEKTISIDRGRLTDAQAKAFGTECAKWIGSRDISGQTSQTAPLNWPGAGAKVDRILHPTRIAGQADGPPVGSTRWTVAVKSGDRIYACVGRMPTQDAHGRVKRDFDFGTFSTKYPDGLGGSGGGFALVIDLSGHKPTKVSTSRWVVAPAEAVTVQRRIVVKGKPTPWFTSEVIDGLGYVQARAEAKLVPGEKFRFETRFLDKDGKPVGASLTEWYVARIDGGAGKTIMLESDGTKPR
ncbi:hypothetical protein F1D05_00570 [Kribbella qitaiheensis]|uniref:Uncharacterized protein n=1 Tax=Kribbella qitaiheensis TaxID=1544730 RepID=A0A7G6WRP9_9ACTN|nr:hypothetical protein [Kribbella qitaiheensis]QNE16664.1 hypothetical protein F1D05_00570 [Kribbella qitaiheensis]